MMVVQVGSELLRICCGPVVKLKPVALRPENLMHSGSTNLPTNNCDKGRDIQEADNSILIQIRFCQKRSIGQDRNEG